MQTDFIALYRGRTVAEAQLVAVTADPEIVSQFVHELLGETESSGEQEERKPLRLVVRGSED